MTQNKRLVIVLDISEEEFSFWDPRMNAIGKSVVNTFHTVPLQRFDWIESGFSRHDPSKLLSYRIATPEAVEGLQISRRPGSSESEAVVVFPPKGSQYHSDSMVFSPVLGKVKVSTEQRPQVQYTMDGYAGRFILARIELISANISVSFAQFGTIWRLVGQISAVDSSSVPAASLPWSTTTQPSLTAKESVRPASTASPSMNTTRREAVQFEVPSAAIPLTISDDQMFIQKLLEILRDPPVHEAKQNFSQRDREKFESTIKKYTVNI